MVLKLCESSTLAACCPMTLINVQKLFRLTETKTFFKTKHQVSANQLQSPQGRIYCPLTNTIKAQINTQTHNQLLVK